MFNDAESGKNFIGLTVSSRRPYFQGLGMPCRTVNEVIKTLEDLHIKKRDKKPVKNPRYEQLTLF